MLKVRHLLLLMMLVSPWTHAMKAIFWQPQLRDNTVSSPQWATLMQSLRGEGFDTLVLQWTQYGSAFADKSSSERLQQRATAAQAAGLKVIVGLNADPEFFTRQKQPAAALSHYLGRLRVADMQQAKRWTERADFHPDGWYLSAEIDDLNWRNPQAREQLLQWLGDTRQQLAQVENKPVYISSFFAGHMTPASYAEMLTEIEQRGIGVWVQDGYGVKTLTPPQRRLYLDSAAGCQPTTPARGVVYELFQTQPGKTFSATSLAPEELKARLRQKPNCGKDRLYFSLRYLPLAKDLLGR
ncbi:DUF4434 family protein [Scandinavium sp. M-37]|uniref:DUF4434 family protein n=1 Tax=Scandinavium sp. M-37 TaxID=3373077 RepID=UPI003744C230